MSALLYNTIGAAENTSFFKKKNKNVQDIVRPARPLKFSYYATQQSSVAYTRSLIGNKVVCST